MQTEFIFILTGVACIRVNMYAFLESLESDKADRRVIYISLRAVLLFPNALWAQVIVVIHNSVMDIPSAATDKRN